MPGQYIALIGDMRGSRELEDRAQVQRRFEAALEDANRVWASGIAAGLIVTTGDEFQGLFHTGEAAIGSLVQVAEAMASVRFTFGLGIGSLDTDLRDQAVGMDGPCFHRARQALEAARTSGWWANVLGLAEPDRAAADALFGLVGTTRARWTARQQEIIELVRRADTQRAVARALDVSPSVISESLAAASFRQVETAEAALAELLDATLEPPADRGEAP